MMRIKMAAVTAVALLILGPISFAGNNVVGYNKIAVPANADVRMAVPFNTTPYNGAGSPSAGAEFTATGTSGSDTITVAAGSLTAGKFDVADVTKSSYYVRLLTGNASGCWMTIKSNTANGFVLDNTLATQRTALLGKVANGDKFRVYKHYTVRGLFPASMYGVSYLNGTVLLLYQNNTGAMVQNPPAWKQLTYTTSGGGRWVGSGVDNNTVVRPETQLIIRNLAASPLVMVTSGAVPDYSVGMLIAPGGDLVIGSGYPVPVVLRASGLGGTNNRVVMFYSNSDPGQNKPAAKQASYTTSGGGRWVGSQVTGDELITPSEMIRLRLPAGETGTKVTVTKPY